jgi:hypothetical protein
MKKKIVYLLLLIFIGAPILQSCGSSRGCKKMRKYRKYSHQPVESLNVYQVNKLLC